MYEVRHVEVDDKVIEDKLEQPKNADSPMLVTDVIVTVVIETHPEKTLSSIVVTVDGMVTILESDPIVVNDIQPENAFFWIFVIFELEVVTVVKDVHPIKA